MAYIWQNVNEDEWAPTELQSTAVAGRGSVEFAVDIHMATRQGDVLLHPSTANTRAATWMILGPTDAQTRINGTLLENGIRVVEDRDAIRVADMPTMYFSTECLAAIEAYPDAEPVFCPRCKRMVSEGDSAVCCPRCGIWHHEQVPDGTACWSYAKTCALCDQSTDLESAGFRWTPEIL